MDAWHVSLNHVGRRIDRGALYFCGFPTLQHIRHKVSLAGQAVAQVLKDRRVGRWLEFHACVCDPWCNSSSDVPLVLQEEDRGGGVPAEQSRGEYDAGHFAQPGGGAGEPSPINSPLNMQYMLQG